MQHLGGLFHYSSFSFSAMAWNQTLNSPTHGAPKASISISGTDQLGAQQTPTRAEQDLGFRFFYQVPGEGMCASHENETPATLPWGLTPGSQAHTEQQWTAWLEVLPAGIPVWKRKEASLSGRSRHQWNCQAAPMLSTHITLDCVHPACYFYLEVIRICTSKGSFIGGWEVQFPTISAGQHSTHSHITRTRFASAQLLLSHLRFMLNTPSIQQPEK